MEKLEKNGKDEMERQNLVTKALEIALQHWMMSNLSWWSCSSMSELFGSKYQDSLAVYKTHKTQQPNLIVFNSYDIHQYRQSLQDQRDDESFLPKQAACQYEDLTDEDRDVLIEYDDTFDIYSADQLACVVTSLRTQYWNPLMLMLQTDTFVIAGKMRDHLQSLHQTVCMFLHNLSKRYNETESLIVYQLYCWSRWQTFYDTLAELFIHFAMFPLLVAEQSHRQSTAKEDPLIWELWSGWIEPHMSRNRYLDQLDLAINRFLQETYSIENLQIVQFCENCEKMLLELNRNMGILIGVYENDELGVMMSVPQHRGSSMGTTAKLDDGQSGSFHLFDQLADIAWYMNTIMKIKIRLFHEPFPIISNIPNGVGMIPIGEAAIELMNHLSALSHQQLVYEIRRVS